MDLDKLADLIEVRLPTCADEAKIQPRASEVCERLGLCNSICATYPLRVRAPRPGHAALRASAGGPCCRWAVELQSVVAREVSLSRSRSTSPTPGPATLWNSGLFGAAG